MKTDNDQNNDQNNDQKDEKNPEGKAKSSQKKSKEPKKKEVKKIEKNYIELMTRERADLKQLTKRKFISIKALKQIHALLLFDSRKTVIEVTEELAVSAQTLQKWREEFKEKRMDSLLVFLEKKKEEEIEEEGDEDESNNEEEE